ncbi:MAG: ubiquinol-cytochrome c reductase iron-sulfur subunit [Anaerolineae bacterium]|jgi:Rieske Fe-S protein|nr:ubiquinol-cytochrome c reductase iron-sulfur subunit [Anaerolineae bacterium]MBT7188952.1 ubiquinol-cytochrome c reductase iron-sulfur subunit [Anaerolineae bacterium]MBT7991448.1 ubiquinol-cytochrome c reductase iron-sulfur subunit [Anaerolineae bacterium]
MASSHRISRRDFAKFVTAALSTIMGAAMGIPVIAYLIDPALKVQSSEAWIPLGPLDGFPEGTPKSFSFTRSNINGWEKTVNSYGGFIVKKSDSDILALSNRCTHLSCSVNWSEEDNAYTCPCHEAYFDMDGGVLDGPPPHALDHFETKVEEGDLYILFPAVPSHGG